MAALLLSSAAVAFHAPAGATGILRSTVATAPSLASARMGLEVRRRRSTTTAVLSFRSTALLGSTGRVRRGQPSTLGLCHRLDHCARRAQAPWATAASRNLAGCPQFAADPPPEPLHPSLAPAGMPRRSWSL
jgi:hypothetical protein